MTLHTAPLVGAHYRPPAKCILACLPAGCHLRIVPEPDNPFDKCALQVFVASRDIPASQHEKLDNSARLYGSSLEDILAREEWHLGYVAAIFAATLQPQIVEFIEQRNGLVEQQDERQVDNGVPATLAFDSAGKPTVQVELP